jgi:RHS repeat-associated protein
LTKERNSTTAGDGQQIPTLTWEDTDARFGFQGQTRDDEIAGKGNSLNTLFRQNNTQTGVWLSIDPEVDKFPARSPYVLYGCNPVLMVDPRGDADYYNVSGTWIGTDGTLSNALYLVHNKAVANQIHSNSQKGVAVSAGSIKKNDMVLLPTHETKAQIDKQRGELQEQAKSQNLQEKSGFQYTSDVFGIGTSYQRTGRMNDSKIKHAPQGTKITHFSNDNGNVIAEAPYEILNLTANSVLNSAIMPMISLRYHLHTEDIVYSDLSYLPGNGIPSKGTGHGTDQSSAIEDIKKGFTGYFMLQDNQENYIYYNEDAEITHEVSKGTIDKIYDRSDKGSSLRNRKEYNEAKSSK